MKSTELLRTLCVLALSWFIVTNLEYLPFLDARCLAAFIGYALLYAVMCNWVSSALKKYVFNSRVSPENKAVLITGCDRGFGHMLAKRLHFEGYKVFAACYFPNGEGGKQLKETVSSNIHVFGLDVTNSDSVAKALDYVQQHLQNSELWAVVNNAGIFNLLDVEFNDEEGYQRMFDVNSLGVVRVTKAFLPLLRKSRGRVITVTSIAGRLSLHATSSYCMSKFAASAFCECLRQEMLSWGVKVITIEPELYRTFMTLPDAITQTVKEAWEKAPEQIKSDYGEKYLEEMTTALTFGLKLANPLQYQVIDSMFDAVSLESPDNSYKPRYDLFRRFSIFCLEHQPKFITDFEIRMFMRLAGRPFPECPKN